MGNHYLPQTQLYSSSSDMTPSTAGQSYSGGNAGGSTGNSALAFGAPGQGLSQGPTASQGQGGKYGPYPNASPNQVGTGTPAAQQPTYDPTLGMNQVYAQMMQTPGTSVSGPAQDFSIPPTPSPVVDGQPLASSIGPMDLYNLGNYSYLGNAGSPTGVSPYWSSPFVSSALSGGKGGA